MTRGSAGSGCAGGVDGWARTARCRCLRRFSPVSAEAWTKDGRPAIERILPARRPAVFRNTLLASSEGREVWSAVLRWSLTQRAMGPGGISIVRHRQRRANQGGRNGAANSPDLL